MPANVEFTFNISWIPHGVSFVCHGCSFILQKYQWKSNLVFSPSNLFTAFCFKSAIKRVMGHVRASGLNRIGMTVHWLELRNRQLHPPSNVIALLCFHAFISKNLFTYILTCICMHMSVHKQLHLCNCLHRCNISNLTIKQSRNVLLI